MENYHHISVGGTINGIRLNGGNDGGNFPCGKTFRYMPSTSSHSVIIRFSRYNTLIDRRSILWMHRINVCNIDDGTVNDDDVSICTDEGDV